MATHSSILAWRIPWTEEPGELQSMGSQRVRCDWATITHSLLFYTFARKEVKVKVAQSYPALWDSMDCNLPGSSVHGILQARLLEWVTFPFSRGSSQPRDWTQVSRIVGRFLPAEPQGSPRILEWVAYPFSSDLRDPGIEPGSPELQTDSLLTELSGKLARKRIDVIWSVLGLTFC